MIQSFLKVLIMGKPLFYTQADLLNAAELRWDKYHDFLPQTTLLYWCGLIISSNCHKIYKSSFGSLCNLYIKKDIMARCYE